jgi:PRTRC genetic system protein A
MINQNYPLIAYRLQNKLDIGTVRAAGFEYVLAGNGLWARAQNAHLEACVPIAPFQVRGLEDATAYVKVNAPKVAEALISSIWEHAHAAMSQVGGAKEVLFYLLPPSEPSRRQWQLIVPEQIATATSVKPKNPFDPAYEAAVIEIHSHHRLAPKFSSVDDKDEVGFRLYGVIGNLDTKPAIRLRVGLYGYFMEFPAGDILTLAEGLAEAYPCRTS